MPRKRRQRVAASWGALLLALFIGSRAAHAYTPGQKEYMAGVRAIDDGDCDIAAKKFRIALAEDPAEGARKFRYTGLNFEDYFPHYYLGLCLEKLGANEEALKELSESERQGAIKQKAVLYRTLQTATGRLQAIAKARPTAAPTTPPTAVPALAPTAVAALKPTATPLVIAKGPTVPPVQIVPTAPPGAKGAKGTAAPVTTPIATRPPQTGPMPTASPEQLAALKVGARAFLKGEFENAIRFLDQGDKTSPMARLVLAYAMASKYLLLKERDSDLIGRARGHYQIARAAGAQPKDDGLISPAVKSILSEQR